MIHQFQRTLATVAGAVKGECQSLCSEGSTVADVNPSRSEQRTPTGTGLSAVSPRFVGCDDVYVLGILGVIVTTRE